MIITTNSNDNPYVLESGMAVRQAAPVIPSVPENETKDFCDCLFECNYQEMVFASDDNSWWKNDKSTLMYQKLISADTINLKLYKNDVFVADIDDDTYGIYKDDWFAELGRRYITFEADWRKIYDIFSHGLYRIEAEKNIIGVDSTDVSHDYLLRFYRDYLADGTVRIETMQNGNILRSQFDYTDMELERSIRIRGQLDKLDPKITVDNYEDTTRVFRQIQARMTDQFELTTYLLPPDIGDFLLYDDLLSNEFLITDYNRFNTVRRRTSVYLEDAPELIKPTTQTNTAFIIKFSDRNDDILKRNY